MNDVPISAELQVAIYAALGALLSLAVSVVTLLRKRVEVEHIRAAAQQALASAEQARAEAEQARVEREIAEATLGEVRALGAALGAAPKEGEG